MKMPGKCTGPKYLSRNGKYEEGVIWEVMTWSEERTDKEKS